MFNTELKRRPPDRKRKAEREEEEEEEEEIPGYPGGSHPDRSSLIQGDVVPCGGASEEGAG